MFKPLNSLLRRFGFRLARVDDPASDSLGFVLHEYEDEVGSFDYARYRKTQTEGNRRKLDSVWVVEEDVAFLAEYIREVVGKPEFGLCHGTRQGREQAWFRDHLGCDVLGTEISDTAESFPNTIQWDFHDVRDDWVDAVDFIYSNAFDHSYDPEACLNSWMSCVRDGGVCIIEHGTLHGPEGSSELDPFGADLAVMPYLIARWSKGRYGVRDLLRAPSARGRRKGVVYIVVQRFPSAASAGA